MAAGDNCTLFDFDDLPGRDNPEAGMTNPGAPLPTWADDSPQWAIDTPGRAINTPGVGLDLTCPPGQSRPRNGQMLPRVAGGDRPWAFDWSIGRGVAAVDPRGMSYRYKTLEDFLRDVPRGVTVVGESTFESYDLQNRQQVMQLAEARGVTLLTVPARGNTRRREAAGMPEKTSQSKRIDIEDALAIQHAAASGAHLKKPAIVDEDWAALREKARKRFIYLRCSGQKDEYALSRMRQLPPFIVQPIDRRVALGPVENYNAVIVAAVGVAAEFVSARADFERLTGLYAHGYPSQFRSDLMHWGWGRQPRKQERITLRVYRRELRWLFHQLKSLRRPRAPVRCAAARLAGRGSGRRGVVRHCGARAGRHRGFGSGGRVRAPARSRASRGADCAGRADAGPGPGTGPRVVRPVKLLCLFCDYAQPWAQCSCSLRCRWAKCKVRVPQ